MSYSSYKIFKKQYSLDNGLTWQDVEPLVGQPRYITSYETLDDCALNTYKAIYYFESGEVLYVPCDGDDRLSGNYGGGKITLLVVGNCVRTLGSVGIIRQLQLPPNGILETIEDSAFSQSGLGGLGTSYNPYVQYIPDTVKYIGNYAFDCTFVNEYHIGSGVTYVGYRAFARGREENRKFYFYGKTPPEFPCGKNPPGWTFHTSGGTADATIKVPCGSELAYYNAICSSNIDGAVRETIYNNIDDECNWSAKFYRPCGQSKSKLIKGSTVSSADTSNVTDIEIAQRSDITTINYRLGGSVLNKLELPDNITRIQNLSNFTTERLFTNKVSYLNYQGGFGSANIEYFEYGTEVPMTIDETSIGASGITCRIGQYGYFGRYSGIYLEFDNVIIENDGNLPLSMAFKGRKINNLYVLPEKLSHYSGQTNYYNNIYAIGEQTGTTWVPAKREYLYDADEDKYYYKEYERKDFENGMWYYTKNYRQGEEFVPEPYWIPCDVTVEDEETGVIYNTEAKVFLLGDNEIPLYERRRSTIVKAYQFKYKWRSILNGITTTGVTKVQCTGQTSIQSGSTYTSATEVTIYENCCTSIGDDAFRYKSYGFSTPNLQKVKMSNSITSIGNNAFNGRIYIESIGKNGSGADVELSNNLQTIGDYAFEYCSGATSIDLPDSITSIGQYAFAYCSGATSLTIGSGVTSIGYNAFYNCKKLTGITINALEPPTLGRYAFSYTNACPIYVPSSSVDAYMSASSWSDYLSRITAIPT